MERAEYFKLRKEILHLIKPNRLKANINLFFCTSFLLFNIVLAQSDNTLIWLLSQLLMGISILQFFFIFHDLGHQNYYESPKTNTIVGHLAGLICALPYFPWRYIHGTHHSWTGWREKDPTLPKIKKEDLTSGQVSFMNFCWKYYIPIFTSIFAVFNFWNYSKLKVLFNDKHRKSHNLLSLIFITLSYSLMIFLFGFTVFMKTYALGLFVFLVFSDPLLISQHAGIRQNSIENIKDIQPLPYFKQEEFTRSLNFPKFINRYILFGFNQHSVHHLFPNLPCYNLIKVKFKTSINLDWKEWLRVAKETPASEFMFIVNEDTPNQKVQYSNTQKSDYHSPSI